MNIDPVQLINFLVGPGSALILLLAIIYTGYKKLWVFGWQWRESEQKRLQAEKERDMYREAAYRAQALADAATSALRKIP